MAEGETKLETSSERFTPDRTLLLKLFEPGELEKIGAQPVDVEKRVEEDLAKLPEFEKKVQALIDDPHESQDFKTWLQERVQKSLEAKRASAGVPIDVPPKPEGVVEPPKGPANPPEEPKPPLAAEGTVMPPAGPVPPGETGQPKPGEPPPGNPPEKKSALASYDVGTDVKKLRAMDMPALITEIFKRAGEFFKGFGALSAVPGAAMKLPKPEDVQNKIAVKPEQEKKYTSPNRSVEYVCEILDRRPIPPDAKTFLENLKALPNAVYKTDKNDFYKAIQAKTIEVGDVLFFQKADKPGEPYLTGVISKLEPLSMKLVTDAGVPREIEVEKSPQFQSEWLGFVDLPFAEKTPTPKT